MFPQLYKYPLPAEEEPWKKILFTVINVLTIVIWVYELGFCIWLLFFCPRMIWWNETAVNFILVLIFILTQLFALIGTWAGGCGIKMRPCVLVTYIVWACLLVVLGAITTALALIYDKTDKDKSEQFWYGVIYALGNLIFMAPSAVLFHWFFSAKTADEGRRYESVPVYFDLVPMH